MLWLAARCAQHGSWRDSVTRYMERTVIVADDHPFTIDGMLTAMRDIKGLKPVGSAGSGLEAIALIKKLKPDCAVLDLSMPGANGLEVFIEARRWSPETRFAIITGISAASLFRQLVDAGVDGLFVKSECPDKICNGVLRVANGERVITEEARVILDKTEKSDLLTSREMQVLQGLARGQNNREIAQWLDVSPKTIDNHRTRLLRKKNVTTTAALLVKCMREGLIEV